MASIVLLTVDCLRADHVGCYGYNRPTTPNIDKFAESEATVFENSYANCPGTRWAFQTLHTGLWTNQIDGLGIPDLDSTPILSQTLRDGGYVTGGFANNGYVSRDYRYDEGFETFYGVKDFTEEQSTFEQVVRSVDKALTKSPVKSWATKLYETFERSVGGSFEPNVTDEDLCEIAIEWIRERQKHDETYFAWIHLMDAHTPYIRHDEYLGEIRGDTDIKHVIHPGRSDLVEVGEKPPACLIDTYDTGVRSADEQIGRVLSTLDTDDVVVITGDHGEEFGRYNGFHHASIHSSLTQVPLLVRAPSLDDGDRVSTPAQHIDIPATILYEADLEIPAQWAGIPLQQVENERDLDDPIFFHLDTQHGVREGDWKLIYDTDTDEVTVYNVPHMGAESEPVKNSAKKEALLERLNVHFDATDDGLKAEMDEHEALSEDIEHNLRDLGYLD